MKIHPGRFLMKLPFCCLLLAGYVAPASAQFKLQESFESTTAPGWTLTDSAVLTAPSIDADGSGWLQLTAAVAAEKGLALNSGFSFAGNQPVAVAFRYVAWGGTGADGLTLFLYDSSTASPMVGAFTGGGLGYCGGAGGYLAIGLDEYGNFSNPFDHCSNGGPGNTPESLVIRGPESSANAWVTTTSVPGGVDDPYVATRPSPKTVLLILTPAVAPAVGYTITAQFQSASDQPFQTLFSNVPFTYAPPAALSVGFSGSTGGATNYHELQGLTAATPDDLQVTMIGPASVLQGTPVTYTVTVGNNGNYTLDTGNAPTVVDNLPASITGTTWTCVGAGGATCDASGSGNINTTNVALPANGSVTYTITGTLDLAATCGATVANTASVDFASTTIFLDPDETNNTATVNSTVICDTTLVASPASLTYGPQQVGVASTSQAVTLTEGINSATITSIAVTGDYSQTNNCPATLAAAQTCTINVIFTPSAVGSRNGTLTILSNPTASPTLASVVTLSGTGINTAPNPFSFTPLINVDPSSVQVSNFITVANTDVPSPISVSTGGQYSINGGAFTSVPGVVSPGAHVRVRLTAASGYSTAASAVLTIGGVSSTFTVTSRARPVPQAGFTPVTGSNISSTQTSNSITVTSITAPAAISITSGAEYSINGAPFTSAAGTVQPGDQVRVRITAPPTYNTTATAVLTIGGTASSFAVTTGAQPPLQHVAVTGGGGAIGMVMLLMLAVIGSLKMVGSRRAALVLPMAGLFLAALGSSPARADTGSWLSNIYGGIRIGDSTSSMTAAKLTAGLQADGFQVMAAGAERGTASGTLYVGYELRDNFAVETAWTYVGRTRAALAGVLPANLNQLLADAAHIVRGSGDIVSLQARYRWPLAQRIDLDLRAGPYVWLTSTDVYVSGVDVLSQTDHGLGYTLGVGPRFTLAQHLGIGVGADYLQSTSDNHFVVFSATLEYRFR